MVAIILAICAGLCWGVGEMFTKSVLHTNKVGPLTAIMVRTSVELPILWLAYYLATYVWKWPRENPAWWKGEAAGGADTATILKLVCGSGLVAGAAAMICFYCALSFGEISKIKPIAFSLAPATAVILGWLVLGEEMNMRKALAVVLILGGVVLLTGK